MHNVKFESIRPVDLVDTKCQVVKQTLLILGRCYWLIQLTIHIISSHSLAARPGYGVKNIDVRPPLDILGKLCRREK